MIESLVVRVCPCLQGVLSTTGHSTNFILTLELPTGEPGECVGGVPDCPRWIKAGGAAICSLKH